MAAGLQESSRWYLFETSAVDLGWHKAFPVAFSLAEALPCSVVSRATVRAGFKGIFGVSSRALSAEEVQSKGISLQAPSLLLSPSHREQQPGEKTGQQIPVPAAGTGGHGLQGDPNPIGWSLEINPPSSECLRWVTSSCYACPSTSSMFLQLRSAPWAGFQKSIKCCGHGAKPQWQGGDRLACSKAKLRIKITCSQAKSQNPRGPQLGRKDNFLLFELLQ